jgi:hypothetical protein
VHNSIPKYAATASISTVMTISFHLNFFKKWFFSSNIIKNPKRWSIEKRKKQRENILKKDKKRRGKKKKSFKSLLK